MSAGRYTDTGELTFGGKSVGLTFNPSANSEVGQIKKTAAHFIDTICGPNSEKLTYAAEYPDVSVEGEVVAMRKLALRAAQEAQMWAVKAATWNS